MDVLQLKLFALERGGLLGQHRLDNRDALLERVRVVADAETRGVELIPVGTDLYGPATVDDVDGALVAVAEAGLVVGDAVLVKGSRVVGLEAVARHLLER